MGESSASCERCITRHCIEQTESGKASFAEEHGSETHEYLVQLA